MDDDYDRDNLELDSTPAPGPKQHKKPLWIRLVKWVAVSFALLFVLLILLLCGITWWLTPHRLSNILDREASAELNADVHTSDVSFTLWSTFPRFSVDIDSVSVRSRNFDGLPESVSRSLPDNADCLLSAGNLSGAVNLFKLLSGKIWLHDVAVDSLHVNMVAVNDSVNNFDIIPAGGGMKRVPYFHISELAIRGGGSVRYTGMPTDTRADVSLTDATLTSDGASDTYKLRVQGDVSACSSGLQVLRDFPFELDGNVKLRFNPFGVSTTDYRVALGQTRGRVSLSLDFADGTVLDNFGYQLDNLTLSDLLSFLPEEKYPVLKHLSANLDMQCGAALTSPYNFSSAYLPSLTVDFNVPDGDVCYSFSDRQRIDVRNVAMTGRFVFDGHHPDKSYVVIPSLHMSGMGVDLNLNGRVTDLTGTPDVRADVNVSGNLAEMSRSLKVLRPYGLSGNVMLKADVGFSVDNGTVTGSILDLETSSDRLKMDYNDCHMDVRGLRIRTSERYDLALNARSIVRDIPVDILASAHSLQFDAPFDSVFVECESPVARATISRRGTGDVRRKFGLQLSGDSVRLSLAGGSAGIRKIDISLTASRMSKPVVSPEFVAPSFWSADSLTMASAAHSPGLLKVKVPEALRQIMADWRTELDLKVNDADVSLNSYKAVNTVRNLDVAASFDSLLIRSADLRSGSSHAVISGRVSNLRQFLTSGTPAPLDVNLNVGIDTIQINQLARAYTASHPNSAIARGDKEEMAQGVDTVAYIVPRNLRAHIRATALETRYINLHLNNLMTDVDIADGIARVDSLHIGSDFGQAAARFVYDTSDMQNITADAAVDINDINIVNFFANFHKLLEMFPQMANLSGELSAHVDGHVLLFPDMYLNVPAVTADARLEGRNLVLRQDPFIRHVTRMLMMPRSDAVRIHDLTVDADVHDNLLEVYPFELQVENYTLGIQGLNNFNGDMFYHIGVEHWPLRMPFGINIKGHYHHPVLRFGGKDWHDSDGATITAGIEDYDRVNIVKEARRYLGEFVHTAATYNGD